jgi:putative glutamine amidotransferase
VGNDALLAKSVLQRLCPDSVQAMSSPSFPLAVVSQRVDFLPDRDETRDSLDQGLVSWLVKAGLATVPVSNALLERNSAEISVDALLDALAPALVVLSGGNSVGECPRRDATEAAMLAWAERNKRPVLGICRGMQMMGVLAGGTLDRVDGHVRTHHQLGGQWPGSVNSFHDFGFKQCPSEYRVLFRAEDGVIEAMRHMSLPWEGWMWHPERGAHHAQDTQRLIQLLNHGN